MELFKHEDKHALAALVAAYEHAEKGLSLIQDVRVEGSGLFIGLDAIDKNSGEGFLDDASEHLYTVLCSVCSRHPCAAWASDVNGLGPSWAINMLMLYDVNIIETEHDLFQLCLLDGYAKHFSHGSAIALIAQFSENGSIAVEALERVCRQTCRSVGLMRHRFHGCWHDGKIPVEMACEFLQENPCFIPMKDLCYATMTCPEFVLGDDEIAEAYRSNLEHQHQVNKAGGFAALCKTKLTTCTKLSHQEILSCDNGFLPETLIDKRARRFAMRAALGKFHRLLVKELEEKPTEVLL